MTESLNRSPSEFSSHLSNNDTEGQLTIAGESTDVNNVDVLDNLDSSIDLLSELLEDSSLEQNNLEQTNADGNDSVNEESSDKVQKRELVLSVDDIERNNGKHQPYRSISSPDPRSSFVPDLLQRPKTLNVVNDKTVTDSPTKRVRRKESFLQTVAKAFRKKIDPPTPTGPKYTVINVQKPSPFPANGFLKDTLYKLTPGDIKTVWCLLRTDFFITYLDEEYKSVEECLSMESVVSAQTVDIPKFASKTDENKLFCFELRTATDRYVFGTPTENGRDNWMQQIGVSLNCKLIHELETYQRIGWVYAREGINGTWFGAWLLLANRTLFYSANNDVTHSIDLRKARCILLQEATEGDCLPQVLEEGPCLLIDYQKASFYFQSWNLLETEGWYSSIRKASRNGSRLEDQQLYSYNVPVIVEKCINFIYLHGTSLTGIYRRAGHKGKSQEIVSQFKQDAWSTQLPTDIYSGHEVATAFKQFFSQLSEPIISINSQEGLRQAFCNPNEDERVLLYQNIFKNYSDINYNTLRMLLRHLHFITEYKDTNLMTSENLANVWGVTILRSKIDDISVPNSKHLNRDLELVGDLINLSSKIFPENEKERHHEMLVRKTWEQHVKNVQQHGTETFRIWIHYGSKDGECYNVEIGLQKTAKDVCEELSHKLEFPANKLILEELILNGNLRRPIHFDEKVLDVVLSWTYWDEFDKKDNVLIISNLDKYEPYLIDSMFPAVMELKYADRKTKTFQISTFELRCNLLTAYRDINKTQEIKSWNIKDIEWYIGSEKARNAPTKHTVTLLEKTEKQNRSVSQPWFGNVLSFSSEFTKTTWISSLWKEQHKKEFLPLAMEYLIKRCHDNQK